MLQRVRPVRSPLHADSRGTRAASSASRSQSFRVVIPAHAVEEELSLANSAVSLKQSGSRDLVRDMEEILRSN